MNMRDFNVKTSSPDEDRLETVLHFVGDTFPRVFVINRLGREVDYVTVDGACASARTSIGTMAERGCVMTDYIHVSDGGEVSFIPGEMTDNRTTELLPCPFCGGEVQWKDGRIRCENCGFGFRRYLDHEKNNQAWNTRAELGSGTCELHDCDGSFSAVNRPVWRCDYGAFMTQYTDATTYHKPRFCPNCGRRVVDEC